MDGDTSTNDTLLGLASGAAGNSLITDLASQEGQQLEAATTALLQVQSLLKLMRLLHQCCLIGMCLAGLSKAHI